MTRLCEKCKSISFNEGRYNAQAVLTCDGFKLEVSPIEGNSFVQEAFDTRPAEHLNLHINDISDMYPSLPTMSKTASMCDFCAFLKQCLLSKDVALAVADHGVDLDSQTFQIGLRLSYSWNPKRVENGTTVGLDALYIYILNLEPYISKDGVWGPGIGDGVFCVVRCTAYSSEFSSSACGSWLRLRPLRNTDRINEETRYWMGRVLLHCESGQASHQDCAKLQNQWNAARPTRAGYTWMPTRLIDVSGGQLRLITTSSLGLTNPPKYVALSYCWGLQPDTTKQLRTTKDTKAARKLNIAFSDMSPVQQDAVTVTRILDVQYLWIDSLCIIQEDKEDWLKESARMGSIYSYAYFTIASLMPSNQSSFLAPSTLQVSIPFQTIFPSQSGITPDSSEFFNLCFESTEVHASGTPRLGKLSRNLEPNRWVTRAWTLQEQALSRRLFLFGPTGVRFMCQSNSTTPTIPNEGAPRSILRIIQGLLTGAAAQEEGYAYWRDFARDFSGRSCTKQSDRLPAMAGLANLLGKSMKIQGEYAAGLWRGDLVNELLWRHLSPEPKHGALDALLEWLRNQETCIAPSWSWIDRFGITFFCYDDAVDNWGQWREEFQLVDGGKGIFGHDYGQLRGAERLPLGLIAMAVGTPQLMRAAELGLRRRREVTPFNSISIKIQGAWFHCMMDYSTATVEGNRDGILQEFEHARLVMLASANPTTRSSGHEAAIGLVIHPKDSFSSNDGKTFVRIGAFYSEPGTGGGTTWFRQNAAVKETIYLV